MLVSISQNNMFILLFLVCVSFDSWGWKIYISAVFCPFFGHFRSSGPSLLLSQAREVILMGPWTGNAQKTGKTWRKCIFFVLRNQNSLKLKKVVYTTVYSVSVSKLTIDVGRNNICTTRLFCKLRLATCEQSWVLYEHKIFHMSFLQRRRDDGGKIWVEYQVLCHQNSPLHSAQEGFQKLRQ